MSQSNEEYRLGRPRALLSTDPPTSAGEACYIGARDMAALTSFYDWLIKQKNVRTPVGELAREVARDATFPRDVASLEALLEHLRTAPNATPRTQAVARSAYRAYERSHAPAPRH